MTFLNGVIMAHHPLTVPLWVGGWLFLLLGRARDESVRLAMRAVFIVFTTVVAILVINYHTKPEYLSPAMTLVFAGGGLAIDRVLAGRWGHKLAAAYGSLLILGGILTAPLVLPILPVNSYIAYAASLGIAPSTAEHQELSDLPQFYADMFGWEEKARDVSRVFHSLQPSERSKCGIYARNYGRCGAIDHLVPPTGFRVPSAATTAIGYGDQATIPGK